MHTISARTSISPLRRLVPLALTAILTACTPASDRPDPTGLVDQANTGAGASQLVALHQFDSCDALGDELRRRAIAQVTPWGLASSPRAMEADVAAARPGAVAEAAGALGQSGGDAAQSTDQGGSSVSSTNVHEAGVDEPDVVKTDGAHVYALSDGSVRILDVRGERTHVASTVDLEGGHPTGLLLHDGRLLVLGTSDIDVSRPGRLDDPPAGDDVATSFVAPSGTRLWSIDVTDPAAAVVTSAVDVEGDLLTARLVDGTARVIVRSLPVPAGLVQPHTTRDEDAALAANRRWVTSSAAQDWLPALAVDRSTAEPLVECTAVRAPREGTDLGIVSVLTLDIAARDLVPDRVDAVLGAADTVYADADSLYVSTTRWPQVLPVEPIPLPAPPIPRPGRPDVPPPGIPEDRPAPDVPSPGIPGGRPDPDIAVEPQPMTTDVHRFDLTADGATYVATGSVPGTVLNQWAMSEHDDVLRIATTVESDGVRDSRSAVHMLRRDGERLVEIGKVGNLGRGERIFAVRYIGDLGLVVTFRQIDPLYTLDLSDPTAPRVLGELKIPGYSAYLHPIGVDHLLGIGQDADLQGRTQGVQISLFDLGELTDPRRVATLPQGGQTSTPVEYDHRALLAWPDRDLYALPVERWDTGQTEMVVVTAADDGRLAQRGRIAVPGDVRFGGGQARALVVGERLITVAGGGVVVHDIDTLDEIDVVTWR